MTRDNDQGGGGMFERAMEMFGPRKSQYHQAASRREMGYQSAVPPHDMAHGSQNAVGRATRNRGPTTRSHGVNHTTDNRGVEKAASVGRGIVRGKSSARGHQLQSPPPVLLPPLPPPQPSSPSETTPEMEAEGSPEHNHDADLYPNLLNSQGTDHEKTSKPLPRHTTDRGTYKSDPELEELRVKLKEAEELAECRLAKNRELVAKYNDLQDLKSRWKNTIERYKHELEEEKTLAATRLANHQHELEVQKSKFDRLNAAHIKSVNSVGTGLEPITDLEFTSKFRDLQDQVGQWSRKAYKHRGKACRYEEFPDCLKDIVYPRVHVQTAKLKFAQLVETVTWAYIEDVILSAWFPDISSTFTQHMTALHGWIRAGDKSPHYDRSEFWRAYTISMLFQFSGVQKSLSEGEDQSSQLVTLLYGLQINPVQLEDNFYATLKELLHSARTLAAELKCQRAVYEVDHNIRVGDPYDEATMVDVSFSMEEREDKMMVVTGIIAKGVAKRPFPGAAEVDAQLSRAKVKVTAM